PAPLNPWMAKYIFPGAYTPTLAEQTKAIEKAGLWVTDVEILRVHYADTLKAWRRRFQQNIDTARALYDDRFCRMWDFYLAGCEAAFRRGELMVFQIQLAKAVDTLPLTRDYMADYDIQT
ncbi:MAG: class I SAM-dependent methyltransferase, partial [Pseudomonadota bacterium]|nr:class I SAM-dependent methyltransferase [Pseudomonadota bacterium]